MKIVFIVLAHQYPHLVRRLLNKILSDNDFLIVIHYDAKAPESEIKILREMKEIDESRLKFAKRVDIRWGEWSMMEAVLNCLEVMFESDWEFDYVYLISAADYPIQPLTYLKSYLADNNGKEFIESFDAEQRWWVAGGIQKERYECWHFFNWRSNPKIFSLSLYLQKLFLIKRRLPEGHRAFVGSQWWTLTKNTCRNLLTLSKDKKVTNFYKRVWVPDEMYFQTLIRLFVDNQNIVSHGLTLYQFSDYGVPVVYYNGHEQYLQNQNFFFARKISNYADQLRDFLDQYTEKSFDNACFDTSSIGIKSECYHDQRLIGRLGLHGKRKIGQIKNSWYGELEWNALRYFVIYGFTDRFMRFFQDFFNQFDTVVCHGYLFDGKEIDFYGECDSLSGYSKTDIKLRDHNRRTFLSDVIQADPSKITGYLLKNKEGQDMLDVHIWDPHAYVFFLKESPIYSFLEKHSEINFDDQIKTSYAIYCRSVLDEQYLIERKLVDSGKFNYSAFSLSVENFFDYGVLHSEIRKISSAIKRSPNMEALESYLQNSSVDFMENTSMSSELLEVDQMIRNEYEILHRREKGAR